MTPPKPPAPDLLRALRRPLLIALVAALAVFTMGARRGAGCGGGRGVTLIDADGETHRYTMPSPPGRFTGTVHLVGAEPRLGMRVARVEWSGDSWSRLLFIPSLAQRVTLHENETLIEFGWPASMAEEPGTFASAAEGRFGAVRSVDIGACSLRQSFADTNDGPGLGRLIDDALFNTIHARANEEARNGCQWACGAFFEPFAYIGCIIGCKDVGADMGRNRPSSIRARFDSAERFDRLTEPATTGQQSRDSLCFSVDYSIYATGCDAPSLRINFCVGLGVRSSWVAAEGIRDLSAPEQETAVLTFQQGDVRVGLVSLDVELPGDSRGGFCGVGSAESFETALEGEIASAMAQAFEDALWQPSLCTTLRTPRQIALCRQSMGTNRVREVDGQIQFRVEPDRIELFPDRLEIVLAEDMLLAGSSDDDGIPSTIDPLSTVDRQTLLFSSQGLCDEDRPNPERTDHPWSITIP
ncbi:MAG: hypothetical protein SFX73_10590 [Kofleriaceae bacterium]|nr:hypothetical protein [Kofleriaceae bacterium]